MLTLKLPPTEAWDNQNEMFIYLPGGVFRFENSLKAMASWESKYRKPFLNGKKRSQQEALDFLCMMCLDEGFHPAYLNQSVVQLLTDYISVKHTASTPIVKGKGGKGKSSRNVTTSEKIYAQMAMAQIPYTCDEWEINRLLMTLEYVADANNPKKKKGRNDKPAGSGVAKSMFARNQMQQAKFGGHQ